MIEDEILYAQAGGAQGLVGAVKIDGKTCFAAWQQGGDVDHIYGSWKIYTVDGKQINLTTKVSYRIENGNGNATINDEAVEFATYEAWVDALEELLTIDGYGYNLEELLPTVYM